MRYTYAIKEIKPKEGNDVYNTTSWDVVPETYQEINEMSLHKLIKKLDAKKFFLVSLDKSLLRKLRKVVSLREISIKCCRKLEMLQNFSYET